MTSPLIQDMLWVCVPHATLFVGRVSENKHWKAVDANITIDGPDNDNFLLFGYALACNGNTKKGTGQGEDHRDDLIVGAPRGDSCSGFGAEKADRGFAYLFRFRAPNTIAV